MGAGKSDLLQGNLQYLHIYNRTRNKNSRYLKK